MRTTRKQFPVNWLTSGRLAFTIHRAKARRRQQIKKMAAQVEGLAAKYRNCTDLSLEDKNSMSVAMT